MIELKSKCCEAKIQLSCPDGVKWECSKCEKLCEYEYVETEEKGKLQDTALYQH